MCVQSLMALPIWSPSFDPIWFWLRSTATIFLLSKIARISFSKSSLIPLFLRLRERKQGSISIPSRSCRMLILEQDVKNPERSIFVIMCSDAKEISFFALAGFPFSTVGGFGILRSSTALINVRSRSSYFFACSFACSPVVIEPRMLGSPSN